MKAFVLNATWDPRSDYQVSASELATQKAMVGSSVWRHPLANFADVRTPDPGAGDVIAVGSRVAGLRVGEPVTIEDMVRCGWCYACRIAQSNHCENLDEIGF